MKILCIGDSWTKGFGIDDVKDTWPRVLESLTDHTVHVIAESGWRNDEILAACEQTLDRESYDLVILGWSGVTRNPKGWSLSYSLQEEVDSPERAAFFARTSVKNLQHTWLIQRRRTEIKAKSKKAQVVHFSVFGDQPGWDEEFKLQSYLEYLANQEGIYFKYSIPIFEFDFLNEKNTVTEEFAQRNFMPDWQYACVEREEVRMRESRQLFLACGHPSQEGHKLWAQYIKDTLAL
jgi:hypothetical protein